MEDRVELGSGEIVQNIVEEAELNSDWDCKVGRRSRDIADSGLDLE